MSKIAVVYWSGTGNTEAMANEVAEGAKAAGAEVDVLTASEFGADKMDAYDAVAFGCPAMGAEELEDSEFEPMFSDCECVHCLTMNHEPHWEARRSHSSDLMDGETENG